MALPDITDIAVLSKRKRRERDVLTSCCDTLVGIDAIDSCNSDVNTLLNAIHVQANHFHNQRRLNALHSSTNSV